MAGPITVEPTRATGAAGGHTRTPSPSACAPVSTSTDTAGPDPGELLARVTRAACDGLGAARCAVHLLRPGGTLLRAATANALGVDPPDDRVRALDHAPLARRAVRTGRPARAGEVPGDLVLIRPGRVCPAVAIPLVVGGEVIGVLEAEMAGGGSCDHHAAAEFAALAEAVLARACGSAADARRERAHVDVGQVRHQLRGLAGAALESADAGHVVARLADLLGRPVALLDPDLRVRDWAAPPALRLTAPPSLAPLALDVPAVRDALDGLGPEHPSVRLAPRPAHGLARRHLVAVLITDGELAGYLDVIEMGRPLGPADTPVAEQAAALLSLHRLAETRAARTAAQTRDDVLADLLRGSRAASDLRRLALHVGLDLRDPHLLVRLPVAADRSAARCRDEATAVLARALDTAAPALAEPDAVVALVRLSGDPGPPALRAVHRRLRDALDGLAGITGVRRAVVSGVCRELPDFPAALAETREVDGIVAGLGGRAEVVPVTELSTLRLVVNGDRADVAVRFAEQCIGPLRRSDETTGGDLVETLRRYLASGAQVRATAKALGVHENTVRYRLGRIEHVTGLDMRRFDALLAAQLAFQVDGLTGAGAAR